MVNVFLICTYKLIFKYLHIHQANNTGFISEGNIVKTQVPRFSEAKEWLKNNGNFLEVDF